MTELVNKPCSGSVVTATQHLMSPLREKVNVCDGNPGTFYHSILRKEEETSPSILVHLGGTYRIMKITVVNVHTGSYCAGQPEKCVKRLDGAKVEVLAGRKIGIVDLTRPFVRVFLMGWKYRQISKASTSSGRVAVGNTVLLCLNYTRS